MGFLYFLNFLSFFWIFDEYLGCSILRAAVGLHLAKSAYDIGNHLPRLGFGTHGRLASRQVGREFPRPRSNYGMPQENVWGPAADHNLGWE